MNTHAMLEKARSKQALVCTGGRCTFRTVRHLIFFSISILLVSCAAPIEQGNTAQSLPQTALPAPTPLSFGEQGDSLLTAVDDVIRELGAPDAHRFIELTGGDGNPWRGELLIHGNAARLFVQPSGAGRDGLLLGPIDAALVEAEPDTLAAALPPLGAPAVTAPSAPDARVEFVRAVHSEAGTWSFDVTLRHADTGWDDYVDGWLVVSEGGEVLGTRILLHPHVNEQPFTRSLSGVTIDEAVDSVQIVPHELVSGYGESLVVPLNEAIEAERYEVVR